MVQPAEAAYQVAAVGEAGFLGNRIQIVVCEQQKVLGLCEAYEFDVLLAALAVLSVKYLGEVGITHVTHFGQVINLQNFVRMPVDIDSYVQNGIVICFSRQLCLEWNTAVVPEAQDLKHKSGQPRKNKSQITVRAL